MDVLRRFHFTTAEVGEARGHTVRLRWYACAPGAQAFPHAHAFGSAVWEKPAELPEEGPGSGHWVESAKPAYLPLPGTHFHGPADWFGSGIPESAFANVPPPTGDICGIPAPVITGGGVAGGESTLALTVSLFAVGGALGSGEALVSVPQRGWGGNVEGGTAPQALHRPQLGSGGNVEGGTGWQGLRTPQHATGGNVEGGQALQLVELVQRMTGGDAESGQAVQLDRAAQAARGGNAEGGQALQLVELVQRMTGGDVESAAALQLVELVQRMTGGDVEAGTAPQVGGTPRVSAGGGVAGGTAGAQGRAGVRSFGGSVAGGTAALQTTAAQPVTGGSVAGGEAILYPPHRGRGGNVEGGTAGTGAVLSPPFGECAHCAAGCTGGSVEVTFAGFTGTLASANGRWVLSQNAPCNWQVGLPADRNLQLNYDPGAEQWLVSLAQETGFVQFAAPAYSCGAPHVFAQIANTINADVPTCYVGRQF